MFSSHRYNTCNEKKKSQKQHSQRYIWCRHCCTSILHKMFHQNMMIHGYHVLIKKRKTGKMSGDGARTNLYEKNDEQLTIFFVCYCSPYSTTRNIMFIWNFTQVFFFGFFFFYIFPRMLSFFFSCIIHLSFGTDEIA